MGEAFIGTICIFILPAGKVPRNWKECDGSLVSTKEYDVLFSLIGNQYGGDGVNTFALPGPAHLPPIPSGSTVRHFICTMGIYPYFD